VSNSDTCAYCGSTETTPTDITPEKTGKYETQEYRCKQCKEQYYALFLNGRYVSRLKYDPEGNRMRYVE